ncbi:N-acetyltransferase [Neobacillus notoginsengisoli]|uniref:N-acetyltransferase n=1 Tax=Neobacillus notoginsengisoli TaxID=1578198 RepID=A0A417YZY0_9BACI|nr:GNAT family N-acetyltransferase [Neobacillus notoginsengisoli]RHW43314.1 N-acetyltransferase [Neobacillus notoginsengisoli]
MQYNHTNNTMTTKRLHLRLFQTSDAPAATKLCNNYNLFKHTLHLPYPYSIEDALTWIARQLENFNADKSYEFAMTNKETGELVGAIALTNNQRFQHGEIAYWVGEEYWGLGYATEAAQAIIQFAFNEKQYHKVFARCFSSNPASGRVLQKLGMEKEGLLKDHVRKEGRFKDLVYYGLINPAH